jgi:probable F420-dependent oxidoreductase
MRFGLTAFCTDWSLDPAKVAGAAEAGGFELLLFPDHTHVPTSRATPFPGGQALPDHYRRIHDPFVASAFAMSATTRLRVGVGVCLLPAREPIALAKEVASLDVLSGGRMVFGVGAGWNAEEVENHGVAAGERWAVMGERVLAMKAIWTQEAAAFDGAHVRFAELWSWPKPAQRPHPPILVGGHGDGVLRRVVEYGDEWLAMAAPGRPPLGDRIARLAELAEEAGRACPAVSVQVYGSPPPAGVVERYIELGVDRIDLSLAHGPPEEMAEALGALGSFIAPYRD